MTGFSLTDIPEVPETIAFTDEQRQLLDQRLEAYSRDPSAGSPWAEVKARITGADR